MATKMNRKKRFRKHLGSFAIVGVVLLMLIFVFSLPKTKLTRKPYNITSVMFSFNLGLHALSV